MSARVLKSLLKVAALAVAGCLLTWLLFEHWNRMPRSDRRFHWGTLFAVLAVLSLGSFLLAAREMFRLLVGYSVEGQDDGAQRAVD